MNPFNVHPFQLRKEEKAPWLLEEMRKLTQHHMEKCEPYRNIIEKTGFSINFPSLSDMPFLPVQLFKMLDLYSVEKNEIIKTLTSSGTTGQQVSKIYLDKETSLNQTKALVAIMTSLLGKKRLPMIIIDTKNVIKDRKAFSARGAGIVGFSSFGRDHFYLLDEAMNLDFDGLEQFLEKHRGEPVFLFGFTFMVWQYFYQACVLAGKTYDLSKGILVHGGGWKKLTEQAVSNDVFKVRLRKQFGLMHIHNYYGMVEQVGSIFIECEHGHFHAPAYADIIIRDENTLEVLPAGQKGLIQVLSILPKSYPGHSLLTEDVGTWLGEDDCPCGRLGKYFAVEGRLPKAELRGCSDTHAYALGGSRL